MLLGHSRDRVAGKWSNFRTRGGNVYADGETFDNEHGKQVAHDIQNGVGGWSVGGDTLNRNDIKQDKRTGRVVLMKTELDEISYASVPVNPIADVSNTVVKGETVKNAVNLDEVFTMLKGQEVENAL